MPLPSEASSRVGRRDRVLRSRGNFRAVLREGRSSRHRLLNVGARPNELGHDRFGYSVGRRVGNAVIRNRVRRRLREIARLTPDRGGYDIVITARPDIVTASFVEISEAFARCVGNAISRGSGGGATASRSGSVETPAGEAGSA